MIVLCGVFLPEAEWIEKESTRLRPLWRGLPRRRCNRRASRGVACGYVGGTQGGEHRSYSGEAGWRCGHATHGFSAYRYVRVPSLLLGLAPGPLSQHFAYAVCLGVPPGLDETLPAARWSCTEGQVRAVGV